ncbi:MAG: tetratricopeptide repeat protein [Streptomyces sp.]|uniref:tetratricopeptide repeat protein n=1 Tax=Streptomyces sp. TaxID=1931 RepID=UPI0025FCFABC|nr:tetratricopeptide repeat protein [Streptomyces sp.]MBW8796976.1 tetratricopeptide repeat protein [Streptomyces sp.]
MKLFRSRDRVDTPPPAGSPLHLANDHFRAGRYAEAAAEARAVAEGDPRHAPPARSIVATALGAQGRHAEALAEYDALLPVFGRKYGAEHLLTLQLRSNRAQTLIALDRYAECEVECAAVARAAVRGTGPQIPILAGAARNGQIYAVNAQGRHEEAEALARDALTARDSPDRLTLALRLGLARSLNGQARHEEALTEAQRAEDLQRSLSEAQRRPETGAVELATATALVGLGRSAEARPLVVAARDACVAAFGPDHYRVAEARALLDRIDGA